MKLKRLGTPANRFVRKDTDCELQIQNKKAIFYKQEFNLSHPKSLPEITEHIVIEENLHAKTLQEINTHTIPLPEWFQKGSDCRVNSKSILENFSPYIRNFKLTDGDVSDPNIIFLTTYSRSFDKFATRNL